MVCLTLLEELPPPLQISTDFVFTLSCGRQSEEEGPSSGGVCTGRGRRWVEVMRVAPLCVWRRWAAFIVLFCRQVLASGCGRRRHRLWVIVQVTSVALGCGHWGHYSPAGSVVTVTNICAAGCGGRCKVPVTVRPVAGIGRKSGEAESGFWRGGFLYQNTEVLNANLTCKMISYYNLKLHQPRGSFPWQIGGGR